MNLKTPEETKSQPGTELSEKDDLQSEYYWAWGLIWLDVSVTMSSLILDVPLYARSRLPAEAHFVTNFK